jgi:hypothetical protein
MDHLVSCTEIARIAGTRRNVVWRLVSNGILPEPIAKTAPPLWTRPSVLSALEAAGIPLVGLNGPAARETKG